MALTAACAATATANRQRPLPSSARKTAFPGGIFRWARRVHRTDPRAGRPRRLIGVSIDPRRVVGSLVYLGTEIVEPGVIRHTEGNRISLGEPDGSRSERCSAIAEALITGGPALPCYHAHPERDLGQATGNVAFNPISALDARPPWPGWHVIQTFARSCGTSWPRSRLWLTAGCDSADLDRTTDCRRREGR